MSYQTRLDNELYEFVEKEANKHNETVGEALRRILESRGVNVPPKKRRTLFAQRRSEIYRLPILETLEETNGEAWVPDIKEKLFPKISPQLTDREKTARKSNREAWWYDAEYERFEMVCEGLIDGTSQRGLWKLTPKGRKRAATEGRTTKPRSRPAGV
jgi:hypothetical protein